MEKILLLTHGGWGVSLKESVEMILGKVPFVQEVALYPKDLLEEFQMRVEHYIHEAFSDAEEQKQFLHLTILTDMFGGTPTNVAAVLANKNCHAIDVITGLNSVLLLEACAQILNQGMLDIDILTSNAQHSIFNVMEKIYKREKDDEI